MTTLVFFAKISAMDKFLSQLPKDLTNEEQIFVLRFKKLFHAISSKDMLRWAIFHIDWKIPYPDFPVFNEANVPPGTDPAVAKAEWDKEEQFLKANLWKRMFSGDEEILGFCP